MPSIFDFPQHVKKAFPKKTERRQYRLEEPVILPDFSDNHEAGTSKKKDQCL